MWQIVILCILAALGLFFGDNDLITRNLDKATSLLEEGGDWDRRNRLKVSGPGGWGWLLCIWQAVVGVVIVSETVISTVWPFESAGTLKALGECP